MEQRDDARREAGSTVGPDEDQQASGGGERYQAAHREHAVERQGQAASRAARGTGPDQGMQQTSTSEHRLGQSGNPSMDAPGANPAEQSQGRVNRVRPQPDDEARLEEQGYPKLGDKLHSRTTQHEHGPNAGGSQQGHPDAGRP